MTLPSWFSSLRHARGGLTHTGARRNRVRAFARRASFEALEGRALLSTVSFFSDSESVNESTGAFNIPVSLSNPPAGKPTVSGLATISCQGGLAADADGNLYVGDFPGDLVREITPAGVVTTFATGLLGPSGLAFGPNGNLYVANHFGGLDEVTPTGKVIDIADGAAFDDPNGIAIDASGNVYVANEGNGTVVKVTPAGVTSLFAAGFGDPGGLAFNAAGDLFVANYSNNTVNEVTSTGEKSTFLSGWNGPDYLAFDASGNLYVTNFNSGIVSKVTPTGAVSTFVSLDDPDYLAFDAAGNLYVGDIDPDVVEKVTQTVAVPFTFGGSAATIAALRGITASPLTFGIGQTTQDITGRLISDPGPPLTLTLTLGAPTGGASLGTPSVNTMTINEPVVVQFGTASETVSESDGTFSIPVTVANTPTEPASVPFALGGSAASGVAFSDLTASPLTIEVGQTTVDITGTLLSDPGPDQTLTLTLGTPTGGAVMGSPSVSTLTIAEPTAVQFSAGSETVNASAGTFSIPVTVAGTPTVSTLQSGFDDPFGLAVDANGNLYVANTDNNTVSELNPAGQVIATLSGFNFPFGLAFDSAGNLYVANAGGDTVSMVTPKGVVSTFASGFSGPTGLAFDSAGNLYVVNETADTVSMVTPKGVVSTFASGFVEPFGLAFHAGNLYVANADSDTISKVTPAGVVSTFASGLGGPIGLAFDSAGNLYVSKDDGTVSEVTPAGVVSPFAFGFNEPAGLAFHAGNLYVTDTGDNTLSDVTQTVAVPYTLGGSAAAGVDFSGVTAGLLTFALGQTTQDVTGTLLSDPGPSQTLTFTLGTPAGGALGSPSVNTLTITEPAQTGTPTPTSTGPAVPPVFLGEARVFSGKGKHKKLRGFEFLFNGALNAGSAQSTGNYHVTQKHGKKPKVLRLKSALYDPSNFSVTISVAGFNTAKRTQVAITGLVGADGAAIPEVITGL
jgi:YVTN family beta-propeller protein